MRDNLEEEKRNIKKNDKRKKAKCDNLGHNKKDQLRKYKKGVKEVMH